MSRNNVYWRHTLISPDRDTNVPDEEWIKTLEDGRRVKFIYQELTEDGALIAAQLAGNEVVYSVVLNKAGLPIVPQVSFARSYPLSRVCVDGRRKSGNTGER